MKWPRFLRRSPAEETARRLYVRAIAQARMPRFYTECGVADTPDGRFDMLALHVVLLMRRLRREHERTAEVAQALFDLMFADMDQNLREMGVSDIRIGKRIKGMAEAFFGRLAAYDAALAGGGEALQGALRRNLFRKAMPSEQALAGVAAYVRREAGALDACSVDRLLAGDYRFGPLPEMGEGAEMGEKE